MAVFTSARRRYGALFTNPRRKRLKFRRNPLPKGHSYLDGQGRLRPGYMQEYYRMPDGRHVRTIKRTDKVEEWGLRRDRPVSFRKRARPLPLPYGASNIRTFAKAAVENQKLDRESARYIVEQKAPVKRKTKKAPAETVVTEVKTEALKTKKAAPKKKATPKKKAAPRKKAAPKKKAEATQTNPLFVRSNPLFVRSNPLFVRSNPKRRRRKSRKNPLFVQKNPLFVRKNPGHAMLAEMPGVGEMLQGLLSSIAMIPVAGPMLASSMSLVVPASIGAVAVELPLRAQAKVAEQTWVPDFLKDQKVYLLVSGAVLGAGSAMVLQKAGKPEMAKALGLSIASAAAGAAYFHHRVEQACAAAGVQSPAAVAATATGSNESTQAATELKGLGALFNYGMGPAYAVEEEHAGSGFGAYLYGT